MKGNFSSINRKVLLIRPNEKEAVGVYENLVVFENWKAARPHDVQVSAEPWGPTFWAVTGLCLRLPTASCLGDLGGGLGLPRTCTCSPHPQTASCTRLSHSRTRAGLVFEGQEHLERGPFGRVHTSAGVLAHGPLSSPLPNAWPSGALERLLASVGCVLGRTDFCRCTRVTQEG